MKKLLAVALILCLLMPCAYAESSGNVLLEIVDDMDLESLLYVRGKIDERIEKLRIEQNNDPENTGIWEIAYFVDEFGDYTDSAYIRNKSLIFGTFSNSATNNSTLCVRLLITKRPRWILYEYGTLQVKNSYSSSSEKYAVTIKDEKGEKVSFTAIIPVGGDRFEFYSSEDDEAFFEMLKTPQVLSVYVIDKKYKSDEYLFKFDTSGFYNVYNQIFGE